MKKIDVIQIVLMAILVLILSQFAFADVYVLKNKTTDEVLMVSEKNDFIVKDDSLEVVTLPNDISFYNLTESYDLYLLKNKKFSLNTRKVTEIEAKKNTDSEKKSKFEAAKVTAKNKLINLGFTADEADYILR